MPVVFGRTAQRSKGRTVANLAHLKRSVIEVKAENNCLAHALIVAIARLENDPNYQSYRKGNKIRPVVARLLEATGIDLINGGGVPALVKFQEHFDDYKIVVYDGFLCDNIIFQGQTGSSKRINLLFDDISRHYHVITNLTGAMAKMYVCRACNKGAIEALVIYVIRHVATAWLVLPAPLLAGFEYIVETVTDTLEAGRATIITRIHLLIRQVRVGPYVNR